MEFILECSHRYRTSERSERVRYRMWTLEDKFHVFKRPCIIVYYINILITMFLTTFRRLPKIFQNCSESLTSVPEHYPNIFRRLPKVAEDFRGGTDDISIIQHNLWVLFKRLCSYSNGNLKTCDNNLIFLHVKISYFYMWKHGFS